MAEEAMTDVKGPSSMACIAIWGCTALQQCLSTSCNNSISGRCLLAELVALAGNGVPDEEVGDKAGVGEGGLGDLQRGDCNKDSTDHNRLSKHDSYCITVIIRTELVVAEHPKEDKQQINVYISLEVGLQSMHCAGQSGVIGSMTGYKRLSKGCFYYL